MKAVQKAQTLISEDAAPKELWDQYKLAYARARMWKAKANTPVHVQQSNQMIELMITALSSLVDPLDAAVHIAHTALLSHPVDNLSDFLRAKRANPASSTDIIDVGTLAKAAQGEIIIWRAAREKQMKLTEGAVDYWEEIRTLPGIPQGAADTVQAKLDSAKKAVDRAKNDLKRLNYRDTQINLWAAYSDALQAEKDVAHFPTDRTAALAANKAWDTLLDTPRNSAFTRKLEALKRSKHKAAQRLHKHWCAYCGKYGDRLQRCGGCTRAYYCDTMCQRKHWPAHKKERPHRP
jgi:hypothetical protein